jgi:hypothetical protein
MKNKRYVKQVLGDFGYNMNSDIILSATDNNGYVHFTERKNGNEFKIIYTKKEKIQKRSKNLNLHEANYNFSEVKLGGKVVIIYLQLNIILKNIKAINYYQSEPFALYLNDTLLFRDNRIIQDFNSDYNATISYKYKKGLEPRWFSANIDTIKSGNAVFKIEKEFYPVELPINSYKVLSTENMILKGGGFQYLQLHILSNDNLNTYVNFLTASEYKIVNGLTKEEFVVSGMSVVKEYPTNNWQINFTTYNEEFDRPNNKLFAKYYLKYTPKPPTKKS